MLHRHEIRFFRGQTFLTGIFLDPSLRHRSPSLVDWIPLNISVNLVSFFFLLELHQQLVDSERIKNEKSVAFIQVL